MDEKNTGNKMETTQFENIAERIRNCRDRISVATNMIRSNMDSMVGSEPNDKDSKVETTSGSGSGSAILPIIQILLSTLENEIFDLEHEQARLSKLF